ncbi:hypothetical protein G7Y89_g168 [Cudoniella acicularis]|uniref:Uncharacterized protein n=1 Tax=Cudoniella acicularis TaxID=354080 RepID=A0A8H4RXQ6_9HELO|nr:hypothetical protein G7Y89_g168 [Cudoniella acicularis]
MPGPSQDLETWERGNLENNIEMENEVAAKFPGCIIHERFTQYSESKNRYPVAFSDERRGERMGSQLPTRDEVLLPAVEEPHQRPSKVQGAQPSSILTVPLNRSKQALNDPALAPSRGDPSASPNFGSGSEVVRPQPQREVTITTTSQLPPPPAPPPATASTSQFQQPQSQPQPQRDQPYASSSPALDSSDTRVFLPHPTRSQSTRHSGSFSPQAPSVSSDDLDLDSRRHTYQQPQAHHTQPQSVTASAPVAEYKKSRNFFDRMRSGRENRLSAEFKPASGSSYNNNSGLARRLSKRQENPPLIRTAQQQQGSVEWQAQDSRSHLPSPQEASEDDVGRDPFLVEELDRENPHSAGHEQGHHPQQTIRAVSNDSEPIPFTSNDDSHQHFHQQQHSPLVGYQPSDSGAQVHYELQSPVHPQQHLQPGFVLNDPYRQANPETVSQLSHDSPIEQRDDQRPISVQSNGQSPTGFAQRSQYPDRTTSIQGSRPLSQVAPQMAPSAGASQQNRRSADPKQTMQGVPGQPESRNEPPPSYTRGQTFPGNQQPPTPGLSPLPPSVGNTQGPNYRGGPLQRDQYGGAAAGGEQGRNTPPPAPPGQDVSELYKELQIKYKKVKGLYFDKTAQVEQLQNTLANQRLSQSRTSLDDSEYMTRFQRLDGATTNLAFNIRKDWRSLPSWLVQYVNQDAMKIGKQEMTAVGRACIAKFLIDEIFNRTFHPGLEIGLSNNLKNIEQNIRRFSPQLNNQEESDALTAKVVQWRLATLEGLRDVLGSPESEEHKKQFSRVATTNLTASLINFLGEPVPSGIEDSAHMIVELAVSIASNLPLESRDISISYPMPGDNLQPFLMKVEGGIPVLENPGVESSSEVDASSTGSGDKDEPLKDSEKGDGKLRKEKPKGGGSMLQSIMGNTSSSGPGVKKPSISSQGGSDGNSEAKGKVSSEDGAQRVRFAGFVGIEVRGRQVLGKAPVWTVS